jgi:Carboxypeptidase regulatory-like domain/TonB dependent receptor
MRSRFVLGWLLALSLVFCFSASTTPAQAVYGSIIGTVNDPQGNAVTGAKVTVTSATKGTTEETTTNESGNYSVTHLIPGTYIVHIEAPSFKTFEAKDVIVQVDTGTRVDAQLQLGAVTQTVEVSGEIPQIKTDRADVSISFNEKYVEDLPILNRNFTNFQLLSPGAQKLVGWSHAATENPQGAQQIMVNGQHFSGTAFQLDGTDNQDPILGIIVVNPNLDAIQEAKITFQNFDAEIGKAIASAVSVQIKSGSNELHGSGFYFWRNNDQVARDPFTQLPNQPFPAGNWKQYGGSVGGAIIKDKLFFFGDYQGTNQSTGITNQLTIPIASVISGCNVNKNPTGFCDLSAYQPNIGNGKVGDPSNYIYDPASSTAPDGSGRSVFCGVQGSVAASSCLPQNNFQIPMNRISPQSSNILAEFPAPQNSSTTNNYNGSGSGPFKQNSFDTRIDWSAPRNFQVFGRFSLDYFSLSGLGTLNTSAGNLGAVGFGPGGLNGSSNVHNYSLATGFDKALATTWLTDFRFGWFRYNPQTHYLDASTAPMDAFGIPGLNTGTGLPGPPITGGLSSFTFHGNAALSSFGDGLNVGRCNCPLTERENQWQGVNNWSKILGNHTIKFGADIRYATNLRVPSDSNRTGQMDFYDGETSNGGTGGLSLATFLLGDVGQFQRYYSTSLNASERQWRFFFYGQDTWRVTSKLTVNYGVRWEDYLPESVNAKGNGGFANLNYGQDRVGGYGSYGLNGNVSNSLTAFAPRLGVAYAFTPKTVVRLGYGRSFDIGVFGSNFGHAVTQNLPVLANEQIQPSTISPLLSNNNIPVFTLGCNPTSPVPCLLPHGPASFGLPLPIAIPANGLLPLEGPLGNVQNHIRPLKQVLPTVDAWNASFQQQLTNTMNLEVTYMANKGTHVFAGQGPSYNANQTPVGAGTNFVKNGQLAGFTPTIPDNQRRPYYNKFTYPGYFVTQIVNGVPTQVQLTCCSSDVNNYFGNNASNNYEALVIKLEKRFSNGLQFLTHYTYSHANAFNDNYYSVGPKFAYGPDQFNRNHVFIISVVYQLPFGHGQKYMSGISKPANFLIGGWQLTQTLNWSSGLPWTPSIGECNNVSDGGVPCRPNILGPAFQQSVKRNPATGVVSWFTPVAPLSYNLLPSLNGQDSCTFARPTSGAFALPACGTIGNAGFDSYTGPRGLWSDFSLAKNFAITERFGAQFRFDAYNVFNHPVMGFNSSNGNTCVDCSGTAGQITDIEQDGSPGSPTGMRQLQFGFRLTF